MELQLRYMTLVLPARDGHQWPGGQFTDPRKIAILDGKERKLYDVIAGRDLFRPYLERVAVRPVRRTTSRATPAAPTFVAGDLRVVSLANWAGRPEVHVRDSVMIDYRTMPMPNNPDILSGSRVIVRIDRDYWAVELGQKLTEKRKLSASELPDELKAKAAPIPIPIPKNSEP